MKNNDALITFTNRLEVRKFTVIFVIKNKLKLFLS